jgi:hypothetical protein
MLLNTCATHRVTNRFVDELLALLQNSILPKLNHLCWSHYEANNLIQNLNLGYNIIHACGKGYVLFYNQYNEVTECPIFS